MVSLGMILKHYKRREIQEAIVECARNREVAVKYGDSGFGKRPDVLSYPEDVLDFAKNKASSFHGSEELWRNPLLLEPGMAKKQLDEMRLGFDLVLDIDCAIVDYSRIAAGLVVRALKHDSVQSISCKFSGNKGFHIGVPFEAFPEKMNGAETRLLFPEAARRTAYYITERIKSQLAGQIMELEKGSVNSVAKKTGKEVREIVRKDGEKLVLDVSPFLEIDTLLISSRHMFRLPYSLHEKSGLVSVPINPDKILEFDRKDAAPERVSVGDFRFLGRANVRMNDAQKLLVQAFDATAKEEAVIKSNEEFEVPAEAVPDKLFPPCVNIIMGGLEDGKKRAVFILINFLSCCGWSYDQIDAVLREWNKRNKEPLREQYMVSQLNYHRQQKKKVLPPNCNNKMYYTDIRVCKPDNTCRKVKNPVNYALIRKGR